MIGGLFPNEWLHPGGNGYWFYSGIFGGSGFFAFIGLLLAWWRTHNCHVHRCLRLQWHQHPDHGHPVCKRHHPDDPRDLSDTSGH